LSCKTSHYDDKLDDFLSCLVLTFSTQFPMIGNKHLDVLTFLLVCDVVDGLASPTLSSPPNQCVLVATFGTASIAREPY
jgi:hypothetical protein